MTTTNGGADVAQLFGAGAHFAQARARRHPSMKPFILGMKARTEIVDLSKTEEQLQSAKTAMGALAAAGKTVMFVGGKTEVSGLVRDAALKVDAPYVAGRWLGGTISNFVEIKKRIDRFADLSAKRESGELAKMYTKLERVKLDREITKLNNRLEGITSMTKRPDALLVVDTRHEAHAVKEARDAGIPIIAIMGSDCNLNDATYPIVANDASRKTVALLLNELVGAFEKGRAA
jgi:small subunit ribosomal protein S2